MSNYLDKNRGFVEGDCETLEGKFFPDAGNAITNSSNTGHGFIVTYSGTGVLTLTLEDEYLQLINYEVNTQLAAAADMKVEMGDVDLPNKTIVLRNVKKSDGSAVQPGAADANNSVSFSFTFKRNNR